MWQNLESLMPNLAVTSPGHAQCQVTQFRKLRFYSETYILVQHVVFPWSLSNDYDITDDDNDANKSKNDDDADDNDDDDDDDDDDNDKSIKEVLWWIVTLQRKQWHTPI